jgi:hypothetical protein
VFSNPSDEDAVFLYFVVIANTDILAVALLPPFQTLSHFMSSQPDHNQNIPAFSGHTASFIIGSDLEPEISRQEYTHNSSSSSDMGLRYMIPASEDSNR